MGPESAPGHKLLNIFVRIATLNKYGANTLDYLSWSTKFGIKHASKIICVSDFTKKDIRELYNADLNKIKVIYNGYNKLLYQPVKNKDKTDKTIEKYGITKPYLLYIGRLEQKKNTPALIEAFANYKEKQKDRILKLVLVGDAGFGYDEVKYAIREFNLDNEVITPGWVEEIDLPYIYDGATAFVFPSRYEGFGIPLIQAMACGVPAVASWASSIPEVAGDAALFFNPHDIDSISDAIEKVINDKTLRIKLIEKGKQRAQNFSWEKSARETLSFIKKM
jgi:glycosyltransferase involved in cell wall biosynthesis